VRSITSDTDLTTRARVRDAAIRLFAAEGYDLVPVRRIAEEAGVSAALVIHHFGSKEGLRQACDDHVLAFVAAKSDPDAVLADLLTHVGDYGRYIARMVTAGTAAGNTLFDRLLQQARTTVTEGVRAGRIRNTDDPESLARVLVLQSLAPLVLHAQVARIAGEETVSADTLLALARPAAQIYTHGVFLDDELIAAVDAAGRVESGSRR
jgi:AcrR family transcriptional regulator